MFENYLLKGLIIGIVFGVPAGLVGLLSIQRGLTQGPAAGFMTGIGSSVADVFYACVGIFGITVISDFLLRYRIVICAAGCLMVMAMGARGFWKAEAAAIPQSDMARPDERRRLFSCFFSSFTIAITNPATILSFMVVFSMFGIEGKKSMGENLQLIGGIFGGTCFWWTAVTLMVSLFRNRITEGFYRKLNRIFGILMVLMGAFIIIRTFAV